MSKKTEALTAKASQPKTSKIRRRLEISISDSDEDDIFLVKPAKRGAAKPASAEESQAGSSSRNPKPKKRSRSRSRSVSPMKVQEEEPIAEVNQELTAEQDTEVPSAQDPETESNDKVHCPFCWKKLSDKLSGMAHVKSCGKNLPTERIFDALQLQEKQVREWAELGISYPGFHQNPASRPDKPARGGARSRKKKLDPELELALALSESLHEEIENRKRASDEYLIKIGLEKEVLPRTNIPDPIQLPPVPQGPSSFRVRFGNKPKSKLPKNVPTSDGPRTRRANTDLTKTRLFTVTDEERQSKISEKVCQILEESEAENSAAQIEYRIHDVEVPLGVSSRLNAFRNETCPLWKMASSEPEISEPAKLVKIIDVFKEERVASASNYQGYYPIDNSTQTVQRKFVDQGTQTDEKDLADNSVQTDQPILTDGSVQTEEKYHTSHSIEIQTSDSTAEETLKLPKDADFTPPKRTRKDWWEQNSDSGDSVLIIDSKLEASPKSEREIDPEFYRSPSMSFGGGSSPEPDSPPATVKIEKDEPNIKAGPSNSRSPPQSSPIPEVIVTPPRRSLTREFSRAIHRTPIPKLRSKMGVDSPAVPAQSFDWGHDDSVFNHLPDHIFLGENPDPSENPNGSNSFTLLPETKAPLQSTSKANPALSQTKLPANPQQNQSKKVKEKSKSKTSYGRRSSSSQPLPTTTTTDFHSYSFKSLTRSTSSPAKDAMISPHGFRNVSSSSPHLDPVDPSAADAHDNFEWGNDDYIFDQIPDILDENIPEYDPHPSLNSRTLTRSRSPSPLPKTKRGKVKAAKEKPSTTAKIKLPKKLGTSQDGAGHSKISKRARSATSMSTFSQSQSYETGNFDAAQTPPNRGRTSLSQGHNPVNPDHTPMLNYSCIDTPILKAELKKYGLKPLPRSKAKKILRHIYTETHK